MAKRVKALVKLQIPAQKATPAPPVGPALGPHGVSSPQFVQQFNERSKNLEEGLIVPVLISVYEDRTFSFEIKTPSTSVLIKKELGIEKGSGVSNKTKVGTLTQEQVERIAQKKMVDLNTINIKEAITIVKGSARSMGIEVEGGN